MYCMLQKQTKSMPGSPAFIHASGLTKHKLEPNVPQHVRIITLKLQTNWFSIKNKQTFASLILKMILRQFNCARWLSAFYETWLRAWSSLSWKRCFDQCPTFLGLKRRWGGGRCTREAGRGAVLRVLLPSLALSGVQHLNRGRQRKQNEWLDMTFRINLRSNPMVSNHGPWTSGFPFVLDI